MPSTEACRLADLVEGLGFTTLWVPETVGRDPFVTATLLLGATQRLKVATGIANIYARDAVTMANTQRALEEAFPGRFLLGLGVSHQHLVDRVRHHDYSKPYSRMASYLRELDEAVFRAVGPQERPATVVAALGPKMLGLAADQADGAHPYFVHHHLLRRQHGFGAEDVAREGSVLHGKRRGFTDDDVADGGSDRLVDAIVAWGSLDDVVGRVRAHLDAGADHVCLQVLPHDPAALPHREWRALAEALLG